MRNSIFLAILFLSFGCSKKNGSGKPAATSQADSIHIDSNLVASIAASDGSTYYFSYDQQGRVSKILYTKDTSSYTKTFQYNNQQIITSSLDQRGQITVDTLQLNKDSSLQSDISVVGGTTSKYTYAYSNGELDSNYLPTATFLQPVLVYTWQNGDCLSYEESGIFYLIGTPRPINNWTYYENQPAQPIDAFRLSEYETYGNATFTIKTAHMAQSYTNLYGTVGYIYVYDAQGRIINIEDSSSDAITTTITYK